jgi:histidyl-tRNA synthetase
VDVFLVAMAEEQRPLMLRIAQALRATGRSVLYPLKPAGVGKQLKEADARGARHAIILGTDEVARDAVTVRTMADGAQAEVSLERLLTEPGSALR